MTKEKIVRRLNLPVTPAFLERIIYQFQPEHCSELTIPCGIRSSSVYITNTSSACVQSASEFAEATPTKLPSQPPRYETRRNFGNYRQLNAAPQINQGRTGDQFSANYNNDHRPHSRHCNQVVRENNDRAPLAAQIRE